MSFFIKDLLYTVLCFILTATFSFGQGLPGSGNAYSFQGRTPYAEINGFGTIGLPMTISLWYFHRPSSPTQNIFITDASQPGLGYHGVFLDINSNDLLGIHTGSGGCYGPPCRRSLRVPFPPYLHYKWVHIAAVVHSIGIFSIYINGVEMTGFDDSSGPFTIARSANPTAKIGATTNAFGPALFGDGLIDELVVWDRELSQQEIREYMCKKIDVPSSTGLFAYYKFDSPGVNTSLTDHSGNGRHGVFVNGGSKVLSGAYIGDESSFDYSFIGNMEHVNSRSDSVAINTSGYFGDIDPPIRSY